MVISPWGSNSFHVKWRWSGRSCAHHPYLGGLVSVLCTGTVNEIDGEATWGEIEAIRIDIIGINLINHTSLYSYSVLTTTATATATESVLLHIFQPKNTIL